MTGSIVGHVVLLSTIFHQLDNIYVFRSYFNGISVSSLHYDHVQTLQKKYATVNPAKSDSDVMFCLQSVSGTYNQYITCVLILSAG